MYKKKREREKKSFLEIAYINTFTYTHAHRDI